MKRGLHPLAPGALFSSASLLLLRRCLCRRSLFRCRRSPSPPAALSSSSSALSFSLSLVRTAPLRGRRATSLSREKQRELWRRETERERARGWGKRISGEKEGALEKNNRSATDRALTPTSFPRPPPKKTKNKTTNRSKPPTSRSARASQSSSKQSLASAPTLPTPLLSKVRVVVEGEREREREREERNRERERVLLLLLAHPLNPPLLLTRPSFPRNSIHPYQNG